jgi:hypothetical protein
MKRCVGVILILLFAAGLATFGAENETLEQLIARANAASPGQQPELYLEVADREVKAAIESYKANKVEDGRAALQQIVDYADKAHALVLKSGKKLPHTEIKIRRMAARLRDLKQNVDADEQAAVQVAIDKLESFRTELLKGMFGSKNPPEKK